jgi:predicted O-linked N-acetylglucosamine transferase (SPINDLY family)
MGWDCIDYTRDRFVIPEQHRDHFAERGLSAGCVQAMIRSSSREAPRPAPGGLPERGSSCCFNQMRKLTPGVFDVWMRLLGQLEGSVLWLVPGNEAAERNLRREASERGVVPERIIFARSLNTPIAARVRLAICFGHAAV